MKISDIIKDKINRFPVGHVFTYDDFISQVKKIDALTKALSRMVVESKIRKLSPGRFYKPQKSDFGEVKPDIYQVVKDLLEENNKIFGYLTGYSVYNQLGLTTQVSSIIQIGVNELKKNITREMYKIRFIKQPNRITKDNIPILRILDAIRNIKEIPGSTVDESCKVLTGIIRKLTMEEMTMLLKLAVKYKPATRALTGALVELATDCKTADLLYKTLNPFTTYNLQISNSVLSNKSKWNIE